MYEWAKGNSYTMIVTLYSNNFTLNNVAAAYFDDIRWCRIGIDSVSNKVAIKPVTKREIDLKLQPMDQLHKVSMGKGYARISNKSILDEVSTLLQLDLNGIKFASSFDEHEKMLIVDLNTKI